VQRKDGNSSFIDPEFSRPDFDFLAAAVKTATFDRLKSALLDGVSPLFVTGAAGSGKTTLLALLRHDWSTSGKLVCFISLSSIYDEGDLVALLQRSLSESEAKQSQLPVVIRSSGSEALQSAIETIRFLPTKPLVLLDGLDEMLNPEIILRFVRHISDKALVVVTGRTTRPDNYVARDFHVLAIEPFTPHDVIELLKRRHPLLALNEEQVRKLYDISRGSPLLANLLAYSIKYPPRYSTR
jgi:hypothetical protein